jgi:hypothetical protein
MPREDAESVRREMAVIIIAMMCAAVCAAPADTVETGGNITGTVVDSATGLPLAGVNVTIAETGAGVSTNDEGEYIFTSVRAGVYTIEYSHIGYVKSILGRIAVAAGETVRADAVLVETWVEFEEIEVRGARYAQTQEDTRTSLIRLRPESANELPGAVEDVMRTLHALPGVVSRSDFSSQLIVRGGGPDQNLIVMDGIEVFNPYRLYGLISMFNPETVADIDLMTGGFPVRYGDRLSGVLDVRNRDGRSDIGIAGNVNTNITNANIVVEGRAPGDVEGNWLFSARRTYYDLIAGPIARSLDLVDGDVAFPNFTDLQGRVTVGPYDNHRLTLTALASRDAVNLVSGSNRPTPDSIYVADRTGHLVLGLAWRYTPGDNYYSGVNLSWYRNTGDADFGGEVLDPNLEGERFSGSDGGRDLRLYDIDISSQYEFSKGSLSYETAYGSDGYEISGGGGIDFITSTIVWRANLGESLRILLRDFDIPLVDRFDQSRSYARLYTWVQNRLKIGERLHAEPGLRMDVYSILGSAHVSPRMNISYLIDDRSTIRAGAGRFLQSPGYEKIFGMAQFIDLADRERVRRLHPEEAVQYIAGADRRLSNSVFARLEAYYKDFTNLIGVDLVQGTRLVADPIPGEDLRYAAGWSAPYSAEIDSLTTVPNNDADGYAYGFELFLEKQPGGPVPAGGAFNRLSGWISWAWSVANRHQYGRRLPFDFDQRHTVNVVAQYRLTERLEAGIRWKFGSGFPHTPPVGIRPRMHVYTENGAVVREVQTDSHGQVIFNVDYGDHTNRNSARLPDYSRVDVRLNWRTSFWGLDWLLYLDVINVLNRTNVLGYRYAVEGIDIKQRTTSMFPILPTFGFSFNF